MLLDCAAFAPTNRLDLAVWKPDFVALSFYKMFGYPTGIGALLARREALARLRRPWFSGGTVVAAGIGAEFVVPLSGHARFEDGTVDYLGIPAVEIGLRRLRRIGVDIVAQRVEALGSWLLAALRGLRHADGSPATRIYGPATWDRRGGTDRVQLPRSRRPRRRRAPRRPGRRGAPHLDPDRLLLQPGRR